MKPKITLTFLCAFSAILLACPVTANPVNIYLPDGLSENVSEDVRELVSNLTDENSDILYRLEVISENGNKADRVAALLTLGKVKASRKDEVGEAKMHLLTCIKIAPDVPDCHVWMGLFHIYGIGTPKDSVAAVTSFRTASRLGSSAGDWHLAMALLKGEGVELDLKEAFSLVEKAARKNYIPGLSSYATMNGLGQGTAINAHLSFNATARAALLGSSDSWLVIARSYGEGLGVEADLDKADAAYVIAAMQGHPQAQAMIEGIRHWPQERQNKFRDSVESHTNLVMAEVKARSTALFSN